MFRRRVAGWRVKLFHQIQVRILDDRIWQCSFVRDFQYTSQSMEQWLASAQEEGDHGVSLGLLGGSCCPATFETPAWSLWACVHGAQHLIDGVACQTIEACGTTLCTMYLPEPWEDPKSRTPNVGLKHSYGVNSRIPKDGSTFSILPAVWVGDQETSLPKASSSSKAWMVQGPTASRP